MANCKAREATTGCLKILGLNVPYKICMQCVPLRRIK